MPRNPLRFSARVCAPVQSVGQQVGSIHPFSEGPWVGVSLGVGSLGMVNGEQGGGVKAGEGWGVGREGRSGWNPLGARTSAPPPECTQPCCCSCGLGAQRKVGAGGKVPSEGLCSLAWAGAGCVGWDPCVQGTCLQPPAPGTIWGPSACPKSCAEISYTQMWVWFLFQRLGVLHVGQKLEEQDEFEKIYKNGRPFL